MARSVGAGGDRGAGQGDSCPRCRGMQRPDLLEPGVIGEPAREISLPCAGASDGPIPWSEKGSVTRGSVTSALWHLGTPLPVPSPAPPAPPFPLIVYLASCRMPTPSPHGWKST